ncbi:hypothetical protein [Noviherbaspirillum cavernae]|uniref:hypothetical protein n=1 Tax=Noviherbaspirillum cavernae TaxID=2320862 RepID=UPI0011C40D30|nr:hypothetical protein [Noviherbaspirillum cavernae]
MKIKKAIPKRMAKLTVVSRGNITYRQVFSQRNLYEPAPLYFLFWAELEGKKKFPLSIAFSALE